MMSADNSLQRDHYWLQRDCRGQHMANDRSQANGFNIYVKMQETQERQKLQKSHNFYFTIRF